MPAIGIDQTLRITKSFVSMTTPIPARDALSSFEQTSSIDHFRGHPGISASLQPCHWNCRGRVYRLPGLWWLYKPRGTRGDWSADRRKPRCRLLFHGQNWCWWKWPVHSARQLWWLSWYSTFGWYRWWSIGWHGCLPSQGYQKSCYHCSWKV